VLSSPAMELFCFSIWGIAAVSHEERAFCHGKSLLSTPAAAGEGLRGLKLATKIERPRPHTP